MGMWDPKWPKSLPTLPGNLTKDSDPVSFQATITYKNNSKLPLPRVSISPSVKVCDGSYGSRVPLRGPGPRFATDVVKYFALRFEPYTPVEYQACTPTKNGKSKCVAAPDAENLYCEAYVQVGSVGCDAHHDTAHYMTWFSIQKCALDSGEGQ
jgi:hypothetical protein